MKRLARPAMVLTIAILLGCAVQSKMHDSSIQVPFTLVNNNISQKLLRSLDSSHTNLVFSPIGITEILHYAIFATKGNTRTEIVSFLYDSTPGTNVAAALKHSAQVLKLDAQQRPYTWMSKIETESYIYPSFLDTINQFFNPEIIGATPNADSSFLEIKFTNKVALTAKWLEPFEKYLTQNKTFHIGPAVECETPMMRDTRYISYTRYRDCHIAELQFRDNIGYLRVLLPVEGYDLAPAVDLMTTRDQARITDKLQRTLVDLSIPKVELNQEHDLIPLLGGLGVKTMFDPNLADYSMLTPSRPLMDIGFNQEVSYDLDEKGVEAIAETVLTLQTGAVMIEEPPKPLILEINRPYLMVVYDSNDLILFVVSIKNPALL